MFNADQNLSTEECFEKKYLNILILKLKELRILQFKTLPGYTNN